MLDSLGLPDPLPYNAVHLDDNEWEFERIPYYYQGQPFYHPIQSIFAFSLNDIWFCGNGIIHWDGTQYNPISIPSTVWGPNRMNKMWGTSSKDLYVVGDNGSIAHSQDRMWSKIESGTTTIINDIWGIMNNQDNTILYCPVSSFFVPGDKKILKIIDNKVDSVSWNRDVRLYSSWTSDENFLYVCGEGAYINKFGSWNHINLPEVGMNSIRGNNINNIFIAGDLGFIAHFNGVSWKTLTSFNDKGYSEVTVKGNIVAICGNYKGLALIEIGKRN